jgi:hypothetical protein
VELKCRKRLILSTEAVTIPTGGPEASSTPACLYAIVAVVDRSRLEVTRQQGILEFTSQNVHVLQDFVKPYVASKVDVVLPDDRI